MLYETGRDSGLLPLGLWSTPGQHGSAGVDQVQALARRACPACSEDAPPFPHRDVEPMPSNTSARFFTAQVGYGTQSRATSGMRLELAPRITDARCHNPRSVSAHGPLDEQASRVDAP